jgi:hypothetical protein
LKPNNFGNKISMANFFGYYVKCAGKQDTVAVIFGRATCGNDKTAFIQIVTKDKSWCEKFDCENNFVAKRGFEMRVGSNHVNEQGMTLNIDSENFRVTGKVKFGKFSPIKYDAMGPFRFLPFMECRHTVVSMQHKISGEIRINETVHNFDGGVGYIEGDRGKSFPKKYFWSQVNHGDISVSASCAIIPYLGIRFKGTICFINVGGQEFRLATYLGARVKEFNKSKLVIVQGRGDDRYCLEIEALDGGPDNARSLLAPVRGKMNRIIHESVERNVRYKFTRGAETVFDFTSGRAAFEYAKA